MACPSSMASERKPPELTPSTTFDNISTVVVQQVRLDSERATYDPDTEARLWRRSQDYLVWYEEDVT